MPYPLKYAVPSVHFILFLLFGLALSYYDSIDPGYETKSLANGVLAIYLVAAIFGLTHTFFFFVSKNMPVSLGVICLVDLLHFVLLILAFAANGGWGVPFLLLFLWGLYVTRTNYIAFKKDATQQDQNLDAGSTKYRKLDETHE